MIGYDPRDPKNRVGRDGLTVYQREHCAMVAGASREKRSWTKKLVRNERGELVWITREELNLLCVGSPGSSTAAGAPITRPVDGFRPAWYPHICPGGMFIRTRGELTAALRHYDKVEVG